MRISGIRHVTVAVRDVERARETFAALFGARGDHIDDAPALAARVCQLDLGAATLRLVEPASAGAPLQAFLGRKGEGFYSLALEVDDLSTAVQELRDAGVRVSEPAETEPGVRSAFIAMAATHGLSIQLVQAASPGDEGPHADELQPDGRPPLDLTPDEWSDVD